MTTTKTIAHVVKIFSALCETTVETIRHIAITETTGNISITFATNFFANLFTTKPSVFTLVIPTERATFPLLMYVMTLLEVPPGHVPTRITPAKSPASSPKIFPKEKAKTG